MPYDPEVRISGFNERGIEWELLYYVPDAARAPPAAVSGATQYDAEPALLGNQVARDRGRVFIPAPTPEAVQEAGGERAFLGGFDLFATLTSEDLDEICQRMTRRLAHASTPVVRQGEEGDSLFILKEGLLSVSIASDGIESMVGQILPGNFFGEMSLLTGAPRSATVTPAGRQPDLRDLAGNLAAYHGGPAGHRRTDERSAGRTPGERPAQNRRRAVRWKTARIRWLNSYWDGSRLSSSVVSGKLGTRKINEHASRHFRQSQRHPLRGRQRFSSLGWPRKPPISSACRKSRRRSPT